jgi:acetyl esterase/lipase
VVHGGFWRAGAASDLPAWDGWLVDEGYVVVDVDYRIAPQPNWPAAVGDVKCAIGWTRAHAAELGVDPKRLALFGRSAGGQLALVAAYAPSDPAVPSSCPAADSSVAAVIALYAPTDLAWAYDHPANPRAYDVRFPLRAYLGGGPTDAEEGYRAASPISYVSSGVPPTLLAHGGRDQLVAVDQAHRLDERLTAVGATHELHVYPYAQHGFDFHFGGFASQRLRPALAAFLQAHLGR